MKKYQEKSLKSKQSIAELFKNNLDDDKISDIRRILNRLRDILPKEYRKETLKKHYEIENNRNLSEQEKEEINDDFTKLVRVLDKKEKYSPNGRDDFDYYGIRDIENLFDEVSYSLQTNFSKKVAWRVITNIMKAEGIKKKDHQ